MKQRNYRSPAKTIEPGTVCGWLTVVGPGPFACNARQRKSTSVCRCRCGRETTVLNANFMANLKRGTMMSCGCYRYSAPGRASKFRGKYFGESTTRLAHCHRLMMSRCYDSTDRSWKFYGAQGITVCEEWHDYQTFKRWALSSGYADKLTLDRIDFHGNYEPSNCRWITIQGQQYNKKSNKWLTYKGLTKPLAVWANELGFNYYTARSRLRYGWTVERAFEAPTNRKEKRHERQEKQQGS